MVRALIIFLFAAVARGQVVDSVVIHVRDMDRAMNFYTNTLPFVVAGNRLQLGDEFIELKPATGAPIPADSRSNDRWFQHIAIIVSDMDKAYAHLRQHNVQNVSPEPQTIPAWNKAAGGIRAFYFRDPENHVLEILWFPPGKGVEKWHKTDRLFLGIDHTAIVVSDTETSLKFYRDKLGFQVAGASENYGPEQERLNNVAGAHLRITSLRGAAGPAIEFLEYLTPRDGRPATDNLLPWETKVISTNPPGRIRDPDGHVILLAQ